jgi:hypothetical protein
VRASKSWGETAPDLTSGRAIVIGLGFGQRRLLRMQRGHFRSQQGDLVVHVLDGVIEIESQAARLAFGAAAWAWAATRSACAA